jgi:hypothetical protein
VGGVDGSPSLAVQVSRVGEECMVSERPPAAVGECSGDGDELPQFALVMVQFSESHALAPGGQRGPALCDLGEPEGGWERAGCTSRLYRIDCHACRERAAALLGEQASPSREAESG